MGTENSKPFEVQKALLNEVKATMYSGKYDENSLLTMLSTIVDSFHKTILEAEELANAKENQRKHFEEMETSMKREIEEYMESEERLIYLAAIDTLTGSYNRGVGLVILEKEIEIIRKNGGYFSICFIDVNGLKYVNDKFGHIEGDELITIICKLIKSSIRFNDVICRLGGDEFLVFFPNTKKENAEKIMNRVLSILDLKNERKLKPYSISFSYGIVQVDSGDTTPIAEIIQNADIKMYEHKQNYKKEAGNETSELD